MSVLAKDSHGAKNRGEHLIVVANPRSAGGRTGADRDRVERAVFRAFEQAELWWTEGPGHATELARLAAARADIVAALGGDGTCHEVVNGLFLAGKSVNPKVIFTILPSGTGGDLKRSLQIPPRLEDSLWNAATGMTLPLDVGRVIWEDAPEKVFINVAGFGANAEVCRRANLSSKRWGGQATFLGAIAQTLRDYRPQRLRWSWDRGAGVEEREFETLAAFCGNGHYCGAGLWVGKEGSMADGRFDLTLLPPVSLFHLPQMLPRAYNGTLGRAEGAVERRVSWVRVHTPVFLELDGEPQREAPVELRVLPRAMQVRGGWLRPPVSAPS